MNKSFAILRPHLVRRWHWYAFGILFLLVANAGQLILPQWIRQTIDHLQKGLPQNQDLKRILLSLAVTAIFIALGRVGWRFCLTGSSRRIEAELRDRLFAHLTVLPPSFYQRTTVGDLLARATNDLEAIRMAVGFALVAFTDAVFLSGSILVILFAQNPLLTLIIVSPLPIITLLILLFGGLISKLFKGVQEAYSGLSTFVQEHLTANRVIKAFVLEDTKDKAFWEANTRFKEANMKLVRLWGFFFPLISALSGLSALLLLLFGGQAVMEGKLSLGQFTASLSYLTMLIWPLMSAGMVVNLLQRGAASLRRIAEILNTAPGITSGATALGRPNRFDLSFRHLTWGYDEPVLHDISLEIPQGTFLGVLGKVGSGKSSLFNLPPRLADPPPGTVFLNGKDIRDYDLKALRNCFALVPQTTFLFSESIKDNLAFAAPGADDDFLRRMAEISTIHRDFDGFSQGWDTLIGERGVTLSGGQKQRLALSRALAARAPVLVLDDALSAVDVETEENIVAHLRQERAGTTSILISHRVATLRRCDWVIVLDAGRIVQAGPPRELLRQEGIFQEIAHLQHAGGEL
ncbi:MAG: ABC transporter ATP-binding protein [Spirochaetales bacterium]|nr:ABC transporter ATP-binding protein [Spirochaetales bacterium]